ncbi:MAG TPA: hypothetical protein ACQGQI_07470 [Xylella sp.]
MLRIPAPRSFDERDWPPQDIISSARLDDEIKVVEIFVSILPANL